MILNSTTSWASPIATSKADKDIYGIIQSFIAIPNQPTEKHLSPQWNLSQTYRQDEGEIDRKALNDAFLTMAFLCLDYDGGMTIEAFEQAFQSYEYSLYTTCNHTPEAPRFRAILPLTGTVPKSNLEAFKQAKRYLTVFPGADKASFEITRWMIQPQSGPGRTYEHRFNESKTLYPHINLMEPVPVKPERVESKGIKFPDLYLKKALPGILAEIQGFNINQRGGSRRTSDQIFIFYMKLFRLYEKCGSYNPDKEAKDILLGYATNPITIKDIQGKKI